MKKKKVKPFVRHVILNYVNDPEPLFEIFRELGYEIYEDPSLIGNSDLGYFISNFPLTYDWLLKNSKPYQLNVKWFLRTYKEEIDRKEELDLVR